MNSFVAFIVKDLLGQASILIAFIAMLGLILQKKSPGKTAEGTFKTLLGFLIMMAGINIIVATLTFLNDIFTQGFGMKGYITDVAAIAGLANRELGSEVALTLLVIFAVNIIIARLTPLKYIFLTGQALLWMATIGAVIGYKSGLAGVPLILTGGIFGGVMAVLMPALAQPVVSHNRRILITVGTGNNQPATAVGLRRRKPQQRRAQFRAAILPGSRRKVAALRART